MRLSEASRLFGQLFPGGTFDKFRACFLCAAVCQFLIDREAEISDLLAGCRVLQFGIFSKATSEEYAIWRRVSHWSFPIFQSD